MNDKKNDIEPELLIIGVLIFIVAPIVAGLMGVDLFKPWR